MRVQRPLDGAHHVHRARPGFRHQKALFVQAYAVLAGVMLRNRRAGKSAAGPDDSGAKGGNQ